MQQNLDELYNLAKERPLSTCEIHSDNDFYGNATLLKKLKCPRPHKCDYGFRCIRLWSMSHPALPFSNKQQILLHKLPNYSRLLCLLSEAF